MQTITPFLWFDNNVEEAVEFYQTIFKDCEITKVVRNNPATPGPDGSVMLINFRLNGQEFVGLNGGPLFHFTEAISFVINCGTQEEIDHYWDGLAEGGQKSNCGWLKDKFGLSWQVVPSALSRLMSSGDPKKSERVMAALMKMDKIDLHVLENAYASEAGVTQ